MVAASTLERLVGTVEALTETVRIAAAHAARLERVVRLLLADAPRETRRDALALLEAPLGE